MGAEKAIDAAPIVAILAIGNVFHTCMGTSASVLSMTGRPGINFIDSLIAVVVYSLLGWVVIPQHGAIGMAWVHSIVIAALNLTRVIQAKVLVGVQPFGRSLFKPITATIAGVVTVGAWKLLTPDTIPFSIAGLTIGGCRLPGALAQVRHGCGGALRLVSPQRPRSTHAQRGGRAMTSDRRDLSEDSPHRSLAEPSRSAVANAVEAWVGAAHARGLSRRQARPSDLRDRRA